MKTIGTILREARSAQGRSLQDLADRTKIRVDFLEAIEREEFALLPNGPFARGFVKSIAVELGLDPEKAVAVYRRDFGKEDDRLLAPRGILHPIQRNWGVGVSPKVLAVFVLAAVAGGFLLFQVLSLRQPPPLTVSEPHDTTEMFSPVVVRGKTSTDVVLLVNTKPVAVDQDGMFRAELELPEGEQTIRVEAQSRNGKNRVVERRVIVVK